MPLKRLRTAPCRRWWSLSLMNVASWLLLFTSAGPYMADAIAWHLLRLWHMAKAVKYKAFTDGGWYETLETMHEERIELSINKVLSDGDGVHFLTAHSAKGLEYETVYLMGANADRWEKSRNPNTNYKLPDTLVAQSGDDPEEDRRLFYVAADTRQKAPAH